MRKKLIPYKDAVYKVNKAYLDKLHFYHDSIVFQVYIDIEEFSNRRNCFSEGALFIADNVTEEQMIARTLFKNTLEIEDFYA